MISFNKLVVHKKSVSLYESRSATFNLLPKVLLDHCKFITRLYRDISRWNYMEMSFFHLPESLKTCRLIVAQHLQDCTRLLGKTQILHAPSLRWVSLNCPHLSFHFFCSLMYCQAFLQLWPINTTAVLYKHLNMKQAC